MIYGIFFALWRRIYGEGSLTGIWGNRGFQSFICVLMLMCCYVENIQSWQCWIMSLGISLWLTFQFWSRSVGAILDCGELIQSGDRYNRWFRIPLDFIYKKLNLPLYTGSYDWWYCTLRYSLCMIPLSVLWSWWYLVPGIMAAPIYWGCKKIYGYYPELITSAGVWLDHYKNLAEIIHGLVFGLTVGLVRWGI